MSHKRFVGLTIALAIAAIAAPAASADSQGFLPRTSASALSKLHARLDSREPATAESVRIVRVAATTGFSWGDAAIGGAAVFAVCMIALGGVLVISNRYPQGRRARSPLRPTS
jgi:hypothetical protein